MTGYYAPPALRSGMRSTALGLNSGKFTMGAQAYAKERSGIQLLAVETHPPNTRTGKRQKRKKQKEAKLTWQLSKVPELYM